MTNKNHKTEKPLSVRKPILALTGQYQNGKSTFLNCLLGGKYAAEGDGTVTTRYNTKYAFGDFPEASILSDGVTTPFDQKEDIFEYANGLCDFPKDSLLQVNVYSPLLQGMDILDSPGYAANQEDNAAANAALEKADFIIFILQKTTDNDRDISFLEAISKCGKPFTTILNCRDDSDPNASETIKKCKIIEDTIKNANLDANHIALSNQKVYPVNLLWAQCGLGYLPADEKNKKQKKVNGCFDEPISAGELLVRSNFLPLRGLLSNFVETFYHYTPTSSLSLCSHICEAWSSRLVELLTKEN